jgi:ADP-ribosyl-[dinitrogen reductase] hydrolase
MTNLLDRYRGTLIGVHIGDSLGAPYEKTYKANEIIADIEARGGLCYFDYPNPWPNDGNGKILPAGRPTDDSDQTADLCHSLIECNSFDAEHLRTSLANSVIYHRSRLWDGKATGAGGTTRKALSDDPEKRAYALSNTIGTNGSLMRSAPMALWFGPDNWSFNDRQHYREHVRQMSAVTHAHPHSIDACWIYTSVLSTILAGDSRPLDALAGDHSPITIRVQSRLFDKHDFPYDPGAWPHRGTAEFSLYVALYALKHAKSFAEGVEIAIKVGGDTDTYAAIAGGLLGAKFGYSGIPQEWREGILGHDQMVAYAEQFYEMRLHQ